MKVQMVCKVATLFLTKQFFIESVILERLLPVN